MFKSKILLRHFPKEIRFLRKCHSKYVPSNFKLQRALIVTKLSRYELEKSFHPDLNEDQLNKVLCDRGIDAEMLLCLHNLNKEFEKSVVKSFLDVGCEVKLANRVAFRRSLSKDVMKWADIIVPVGGDGTFLLSAGRASPLFARSQQKIPIVGFNSDPEHSEGRLMLPKQYSENPAEAVARIKSGDFQWMHRTRIRISMLANNGRVPESTDLYRHTVTKMEQEKTKPEILDKCLATKYKAKVKRVLPYLALNEVFIGEQLSARVSYLHLMINDDDFFSKTKCSGLCVSTGTGSTSWHMSINRITPQQVENLQNVLPYADAKSLDYHAIADAFNQRLIFSADNPSICYSVREQICVGVWPSPQNFQASRFVKKLFVKSCCIDANLVIDGSISYPFNSGSKALLEVHPEDALLTISLD